MVKVVSEMQQINGMALGGIGSGSVEINQNGILQSFDIFNLGKWASREAEKFKKGDLYDYQSNIMPFTIRTKQGQDVPKIRKLFQDTDAKEFRSLMYSWHKQVEKIEWNPNFPVCELNYKDKTLPVTIKSEFSSPFVPLNSKLSGTPGFYVTFTVENITDKAVEVSLMAKLKNPVNRGQKRRQLQNVVTRSSKNVSVTMSSTSEGKEPQNGSICFSASGGELSFIQSDFAQYFQNYVLGGAFGVTEQSYLFGFRERGRLPNCGFETVPSTILSLTNEQVEAMTLEQLDDILKQLLKQASALAPYERVCKIDPNLLQTAEKKAQFICIIKDKMNELLLDEKGNETWGDAALCSTLTLNPGEKEQVKFFVSWYFPNHFSDNGNFVGHMYTNWFDNAKQVNEFMVERYDCITTATGEFSRTLRKSTAPTSFVDNWCNHLNTLVKCSWWSKQGDFAIWEGYGSCGFHTMDITYQGSFGLLAIFPDLQLAQMELGAKFQREDGRVHHFFTPDFESVDNGFDRVDMNPQFVLLVCRDYLWTGDMEYLKRLWNPIVKAMESIERLDENGDGLPDQETSTNTYDAWHFKGTPSYISSLWLASLLAGIRLADDLGETVLSQKWQAILKNGKKSFVETLWNGEYYSLWVDDEARDECCMADQIDGHWYTELIGIGKFLPDVQLESALKAILKYNFHEETGLINAIYPPNCAPTMYTCDNVQALANWSGVEYAFASTLLERGMVKSATKLSDNIEQRYFHAGRIFNHEECGDHYYRALSSWALLLSATGFKLDVPRKTVTITPPIKELQSPWFTPTGYGYFENRQSTFEMHCNHGELKCATMVLKVGFKVAKATVGGKSVSFTAVVTEDVQTLNFGQEIVLVSGETVVVG